MKKTVYILILNFIYFNFSYSQARRIVIEMNHAKYDTTLSAQDINDIEKNLTKLVSQYIEWGSFQNDDGIYSDSMVGPFVNLFANDALMYSDIHLDYQEMHPKNYASDVKKYFGDYGLDATIDYAGLISLMQSADDREFLAHLTIQKINYSKISKINKRQFFKNGQMVKFDMFVSIDSKTKTYKIKKITNETAATAADVDLIASIELTEEDTEGPHNDDVGLSEKDIKASDIYAIELVEEDTKARDVIDIKLAEKNIKARDFIDIESSEKNTEKRVNIEVEIAAEDIASSKEKNNPKPPQIIASTAFPKQHNNITKTMPLLVDNSFMRLSIRSQFAQQNSDINHTSRISSPLTIEASINKKTVLNTYLSMGLQISKRDLVSLFEDESDKLVDYGSIPYITTSKTSLLVPNEETNIQMIEESDMEISEKISYNQYAFLLGVQKQIIFQKFNGYFGFDLLPGIQLFRSGMRQVTGLTNTQIPNNDYFPTLDVINTIDPDALLASAYQVSNGEDILLRASNRLLIDASIHIMMEYSLHEKISLSTKIGKQFNMWMQQNSNYNPQLNPISLNTEQHIKLNPMHFDFGIILKY